MHRNYQLVTVVTGVFSVGCAGVDAANQPEAESSVEAASKSAPLMGATGSCLDPGVGRMEFKYKIGDLKNPQVSSADVQSDIGEWWNRSDCAAFVVDFVQAGATDNGRSGRAAFFSGIIDHNFIGPGDDRCSQAHLSKKIVSHLQGDDPANWQTILDVGDKYGCGWEPVWLGSTYGDEPQEAWFVLMDRFRVAVQGWVFAFPAPVEAYMVNEDDGGCITEKACCYKGKPLTECI